MDSSPLDISVRATTAFYGAQRWPLTIVELSRRLIPPRRFGAATDALPSIGEVHERIERLVEADALRFRGGLVAPADMPDRIFDERTARENVCAQKWRKMWPKARWLYLVPFVRSLLASGSLALGNTSVESDWDMLVLVEQKRLYTARAGLLLMAVLMGRLRRKHDRIAADRFCFNHYLTTDALAFRHRSLYTAHVLSLLVPIVDPEAYLPRLWQANQWTRTWCRHTAGTATVRRQSTPSRGVRICKWTMELILRSPLGDAGEWMLRAWQQRRIRANASTHARGGRVRFTDQEIEFHPHSAEKPVLASYNRNLRKWGLERFTERDSGLR